MPTRAGAYLPRTRTALKSFGHSLCAQGEGYLGPSYRPMPQDLTESPLIQSIPEGAPPAYSLGGGGGGGNGGSASRGVSLPRLDLPVRRSPLLTDESPTNSLMDFLEPSSQPVWSVSIPTAGVFSAPSAPGCVILRAVR